MLVKYWEFMEVEIINWSNQSLSIVSGDRKDIFFFFGRKKSCTKHTFLWGYKERE